ncbi:hypothetical protein PPL_03977 [Heterostelium album PN500]|uniref:Uncharacterized protein n=1 Tax=Heterostelium pallidum (strain ATCC 26659 / Pp 5 / PN500) TaxID=670386 RepID=D3B5N9_HETP5|nr:hypothetical protein PPL_03977 [Heterostelium album PN500]EFA83187.1 hypothetical protein PPL_03977 [Heterostelium album PN500]|eukprot:XP_020435304.1 hypothetical protein PPL_03977 [Heterostelium album PN500]
MNLFVLDKNSKKSVRYHCDKHVVKLILEAVQMLYCAYHVLEADDDAWKASSPTPLKLTHKNHPINKWVRTNASSYDFTVDYAANLLDEYTLRYGKIHSYKEHVDWLSKNKPSKLDKSNQLTLMPVAMPEEYRVQPMNDWDDVVKSYRTYYIKEKLRFCSYKGVEWPDWLPDKSTFIAPVSSPKKSKTKSNSSSTTTTSRKAKLNATK